MFMMMLAADAAAPAPAPTAEALASGVWLIPGSFRPNRQPDGNTVVFEGPKALVVMDTGRHDWQRQAILDFAKARGKPVAAIVNSHWHLDHVSGNAAVKAAYPGARSYSSNAVEGALTGFLARSAADAREYLKRDDVPPETREDIEHDLDTAAHGERIRPDVVVTASGVRDLGGVRLQLNLAPNAATDGDVWVYDASRRVAAVGDLVTFPAPFLDTGCPKGWSRALGEVAASPFETLIPGHGKPMSRAEFTVWRGAYDAFIACAASDRSEADCAAGWSRDTAALLARNEISAKRAEGMAGYYVGMLRKNGGKSPSCKAS